MKYKNMKWIIGFIIFSIITICIIINYPVIDIVVKSQAPITVIDKLKIREKEIEKLQKIKNKESDLEVDGYISYLGRKAYTNEIYTYHQIVYVDIVFDINKRIILKYDGDVCYKYILSLVDGSKMIFNQDNKKYQIVDIQTQHIDGDTVKDYIDPFIYNQSGLIKKEKQKGLEEKYTLPDNRGDISIAVYETIKDFKNYNMKFEVYAKNTDAVLIALHRGVTLSTVFEWFPQASFNDYGVLTKNTPLCVEKKLGFIYGREVEIAEVFDESKNSVSVISSWNNGEASMSLEKNQSVGTGTSIINSFITIQPFGMNLCDEYFKNLGIQQYLNSL